MSELTEGLIETTDRTVEHLTAYKLLIEQVLELKEKALLCEVTDPEGDFTKCTCCGAYALNSPFAHGPDCLAKAILEVKL